MCVANTMMESEGRKAKINNAQITITTSPSVTRRIRTRLRLGPMIDKGPFYKRPAYHLTILKRGCVCLVYKLHNLIDKRAYVYTLPTTREDELYETGIADLDKIQEPLKYLASFFCLDMKQFGDVCVNNTYLLQVFCLEENC